MRRLLFAYATAVFLNLAVASSYLAPAPPVERVPIVRVSRRNGGAARFHPGELTPGGGIIVRTYRASRGAIHAN